MSDSKPPYRHQIHCMDYLRQMRNAAKEERRIVQDLIDRGFVNTFHDQWELPT